MSFYREVNEEATRIPMQDASTGPELSFFESMKRGWQFGNLYESQFGVQVDIINQEEENNYRIVKAGGTPPKRAFRTDAEVVPGSGLTAAAPDKASSLVDAMNSSDEGTYRAIVGDRDRELSALQLRFPDAGIKTYGQMYQDTQERYRKLKAGNEREYSAGGTLGFFVGEAASAFNPKTNPLSVATAPIGGAGKTVAARVLSQSGAQAAIQGVEEITGVRANKRLLGEDPTAAESLLNVGMAGLGGAGLQVLGELGYAGLKAGTKRWFKTSAADPAPPPPGPEPAPEPPVDYKSPVLNEMPSISAEANARLTRAVQETAGTAGSTMRTARADFAHVARETQSWTGPRPWEIEPTTMSRPFLPSESPTGRLIQTVPGETVDEIARRVDPDTFRLYDRMAAMKREAQAQTATALAARNVDVEKELTPLRTQIADLEDKLENANRRKTKIYDKKLDELRGQLAEKQAALMGADTNAAAIYRKQVMKADEDMRDLAPAVSRAYARAQGKWDLMEGQRKQIRTMIEKGEESIERIGPPAPTAVDRAEMDFSKAPISDVVPELSVQRGIKKTGEDVADVVKRVHEEDRKLDEIAADALTARVPKALEDGNVKIDVEGKEVVLDLDDKIMVQLDTDEVPRQTTLREMFEELVEYEDVLKAVGTCSVGTTSAIV